MHFLSPFPLSIRWRGGTGVRLSRSSNDQPLLTLTRSPGPGSGDAILETLGPTTDPPSDEWSDTS